MQTGERRGSANSASNTVLLKCKPSVPYRLNGPASQNIQCCGQRGDTLHQNQEGVCPDHIMPDSVRTITSTGWGGELTKGQVQHVGMLWHWPHERSSIVVLLITTSHPEDRMRLCGQGQNCHHGFSKLERGSELQVCRRKAPLSLLKPPTETTFDTPSAASIKATATKAPTSVCRANSINVHLYTSLHQKQGFKYGAGVPQLVPSTSVSHGMQAQK